LFLVISRALTGSCACHANRIFKRTNFNRNLVSSTAYTARLHFDQRSDGVESFLEDFQGVAVLAFFNLFQRAINDTLGNGFLAALLRGS
jgi:hypothetical protein